MITFVKWMNKALSLVPPWQNLWNWLNTAFRDVCEGTCTKVVTSGWTDRLQ
jgi:hypothetical protein